MDRTYVAEPAVCGSTTPVVIVAMHLFGVDASLRAAADRFAAAGMAAIVPDLYRSFDAPDGDASSDASLFLPLARSLTTPLIDREFDEALNRMRERHSNAKVAIAGFCMGGVMATYRAAKGAGRYHAAAAWYGLSSDIAAGDVGIPLVASYGAEDRGIPSERIEAFRDGLTVENDIEIYPSAGHAFCDHTRPSYRKEACEASWKRTLAFLASHLNA